MRERYYNLSRMRALRRLEAMFRNRILSAPIIRCVRRMIGGRAIGLRLADASTV